MSVFSRSGSRTAATSKMEHFAIIVNGWKSSTIITKIFILDVTAVLDPPLFKVDNNDNRMTSFVFVTLN